MDTVDAVDYARRLLVPGNDEQGQLLDPGAFTGSFAAINVGLETFYESLVAQGGAAVQVEWRPPAGGNENLMALLEKMRS